MTPDRRVPSRDLRPESLSDANQRIWDMALNLVHPALLYVIFQLVILDHLGDRLGDGRPWTALSIGVYVFQFLGAWAVFYTTLLRDMGYRCPFGTILLLGGLLGAILQYWLFPDPSATPRSGIWVWVGAQLALAAIGWMLTARLWQRHKQQFLQEVLPPADSEHRP